MPTNESNPEVGLRRQKMAKRLGQPFSGGLTDELAKTRVRLLIVGALSIGIVIADLHIGQNSSILGLQINNLNDGVVKWALAISTGYLWVHFVWGSVESFSEWKLRLTGTTAYDGSPERVGNLDWGLDHLNDPRQSTLYSWWLRSCESTNFAQRSIDQMEATSRQWAKEYEAWQAHPPGIKDGHNPIERLVDPLLQLRDQNSRLLEFLESERIAVSLARFDSWFSFLLRLQSLRWLLFDLALPFTVGFCALVLLGRSLFP